MSEGVSPLLPKDSKMNWFLLIIAGSPLLYNGDGGWSSILKKNRSVNVPFKKVIMRE